MWIFFVKVAYFAYFVYFAKPTTGGPLPVQQAVGTCSNLGAVRQFEVFGAGECEMLHCEASHTDSGFDKV